MNRHGFLPAVTLFLFVAQVNGALSWQFNYLDSAAAGFSFSTSASVGFGNRGDVGRKILGEADPDAGKADGTVVFNFEDFQWDLDDEVPSNAFDFKSTMIHELAHVIGFATTIRRNGRDSDFTTPGLPGKWSPFDAFVGDLVGAVIDSSFAIDVNRWDDASTGGAGDDGLLFHGAHAVAANGGDPVPLYSPSSYAADSTGSHLDDEFFTSATLVMEATATTGLGSRELDPLELAILRDIGFEQASTPEPSSSSLVLVALIMMRRGLASRY